MKQIVAHKKLSTLHGILLVAGLIAVLLVLNYFVLGFLSTYVGNKASSLAFWVLGGLVAWIVLRVYVLRYTYEMGGDVLRLTRSYGKRERFIEDIYLRQLVFVGTQQEAAKRWPNAKRVRAVHVKGENPVSAVVYKTADGHGVALIQANEELKEALRACIKAK